MAFGTKRFVLAQFGSRKSSTFAVENRQSGLCYTEKERKKSNKFAHMKTFSYLCAVFLEIDIF